MTFTSGMKHIILFDRFRLLRKLRQSLRLSVHYEKLQQIPPTLNEHSALRATYPVLPNALFDVILHPS